MDIDALQDEYFVSSLHHGENLLFFILFEYKMNAKHNLLSGRPPTSGVDKYIIEFLSDSIISIAWAGKKSVFF